MNTDRWSVIYSRSRHVECMVIDQLTERQLTLTLINAVVGHVAMATHHVATTARRVAMTTHCPVVTAHRVTTTNRMATNSPVATTSELVATTHSSAGAGLGHVARQLGLGLGVGLGGSPYGF